MLSVQNQNKINTNLQSWLQYLITIAANHRIILDVDGIIEKGGNQNMMRSIFPREKPTWLHAVIPTSAFL